MNFIGIIPARYASTRFPGKPLTDINGQSMIERVYKQAKKTKVLNDVYVATDDKRIFEHVINFGGQAIMTSTKHKSGTDRCAEVLSQLESTSNIQYDVVVNIQGDEPFISPKQIELLTECFSTDDVPIATLIKKIDTDEELNNPNIVKVVVNKMKEAIYFSRHPIPYFRSDNSKQKHNRNIYYKHIGLYAYKADVLKKLTTLPQSSLEIAESLEQLRWIENGCKIITAVTNIESKGVDSPDDLKQLPNC